MKILYLLLFISVSLFTNTKPLLSVERSSYFRNPDAVEQLLKKQRKKYRDPDYPRIIKNWKTYIHKKYGLSLGTDYNIIVFRTTQTSQKNGSTSGVLRVYGAWELIGRDTANTGSLIFKVEHRHSYTTIAPTDFGFEIGYVGLVQSTFSDQGFRTTNLYWKQKAGNGRFLAFAGFLDVTDYVDVYLLASPWESFNNLAFATGSGTIAGLPDGALGIMGAAWLSKRIYLVAGVADANASPPNIFRGFKTFFKDFETFKSLEVGWTTELQKVFLDNIHITLWHIDTRKDAATPSGWGASLSATTTFRDRWLVFLRGGWSDDGGSLLSRSLSTGAGYQAHPGGSVLGAAVNWGKPNRKAFPDARENQYTAEIFYRWQPLLYLQITPNAQFIVKPALAPDNDITTLLGLRLRISL